MRSGMTIFVIVCMGALVFLLYFLTALCKELRPSRVSTKHNEGSTTGEKGVVHFEAREYFELSAEHRER